MGRTERYGTHQWDTLKCSIKIENHRSSAPGVNAPLRKKTDQRAGQKIVLLSNLNSIHLRAHINHGQADVLYRFLNC